MSKTLAEKLFEIQDWEEELWKECNRIIGCFNKDWMNYNITDCWVDAYDESVELVFKPGAEELTREQADQILNLGFGQIYASHGEDGYNWTRNAKYKCTPRNGDQERALSFKYRDQVEELKKENEQLKSSIPYLASQMDSRPMTAEERKATASNFWAEFEKNQEPLPPEMQKAINDNFWQLLL